MNTSGTLLFFLPLLLIVAGFGIVKGDVIDFDSLVDGEVVTDQFASATFSSTVGQQNVVTAQNFGSSPPNFLCTADVNGGLNCTNETIVDFTSPVSNLTLFSIGDNDAGVTALIDVFEDNVFSATVDVITNGDFNDFEMVDLTAFSDVTSIRIYSITDGGGLGWDDFSFDTTSIPEPTSTALLGVCLIAGCMRRRR